MLGYRYIEANKSGKIVSKTIKRWWWKDKVEEIFVPCPDVYMIDEDKGICPLIIGHIKALDHFGKKNLAIGTKVKAKVEYSVEIDAEDLSVEKWRPIKYLEEK